MKLHSDLNSYQLNYPASPLVQGHYRWSYAVPKEDPQVNLRSKRGKEHRTRSVQVQNMNISMQQGQVSVKYTTKR